jgi:glycyl-tRNA synthetase beta chain
MSEFLLELLCEEIPARMQSRAAEDLKKLFGDAFAAANIEYSHLETYVTPRRLALIVGGLPLHSPDSIEERKGPKVGAPDAAIQGFLKGAGIAGLEQAEQRDTGKGLFWFAVTKKFGRAMTEVLPEIVGDIISKFPWPKSMRWSDHPLTWVRPLHNVMMVFDGVALIDHIEFDTLILPGNKTTIGHRFLSPHRFEVSGFEDYKAQLYEHKVVLDRTERRAEIERQLHAKARAEGLVLVEDAGLLDEVTGLVEWPTVLIGSIDAAYMDLPWQVRATTMRTNQKYFTLNHTDGTPAARFALVANIPGSDGGAAIIAGNERVLRARLSDARFFWDQDLKIKLEDRLPALATITFHEKLGSLKDKTERVADIAAALAGKIPGCDATFVAQAVRVSKCDLVTGMVGEFPELQGVMGRYYALNDGYDPAIAEAIADHYKPLGPNDTCPTAPVSVAVALADKLYMLAGFFTIGEIPTGSRDPFALRRAALGIIRLITENNLRLNIRHEILHAQSTINGKSDRLIVDSIFDFIVDRLKVNLKDQGIRQDQINAVLNAGENNDLTQIIVRAEALKDFLSTDNGVSLLAAYKRAANILDIESKKDGIAYDASFDAALLAESAEQQLGKNLRNSLAAELIKNNRYSESMALLAGLRAPIDAFFEAVRVNDADPALRQNRLKLLSAFVGTVNTIADFSRLEGKT